MTKIMVFAQPMHDIIKNDCHIIVYRSSGSRRVEFSSNYDYFMLKTNSIIITTSSPSCFLISVKTDKANKATLFLNQKI